MGEPSNIGQTGINSIRIKGQRVEELPLGQGNEAKEGLAKSRLADRLNKIANINAKYPTHRVDYLRGRINECEDNIIRVKGTKTEQNKMIEDYTGQITMCIFRDTEIAKLDQQVVDLEITDSDEFNAKVKALKAKYPPYNVKAMKQQIVQCKEAIERCDDVIEKEHNSIAEFREVLALCRQRDKELKQYNAVAQGS